MIFVQLFHWLKSYPSHFSDLNRGFHDGRTDNVACFERFQDVSWEFGWKAFLKSKKLTMQSSLRGWASNTNLQATWLLEKELFWGLTAEPAFSGFFAMFARWVCPLYGSWIIMAAKDIDWEVRSKQLSHTGMAWPFTNSSSLCFSAVRGGSMRFLYHCLSILWFSEVFSTRPDLWTAQFKSLKRNPIPPRPVKKLCVLLPKSLPPRSPTRG